MQSAQLRRDDHEERHLALALLKSGDKDTTRGPKHPLGKRLRAWWEGYELLPLSADGDGTGEVAGTGT